MALFRLESGPIPLHHQVYTDLRRALNAEWQPGDRLPTERELAQRYGCSLITVRRALGELAREGRIERTRGRGTYVTEVPIERDLAGGLSFAEEMERRGLVPETRLVDSRLETASSAVAERLALRTGDPIAYLERLRLADGAPLLLEQVRLPAQMFPGLLELDLERNSLYDLLAHRYGTQVARALEAIEPVLLPAREARLLDVPRRTPALAVEGVAYSSAGVAVELGRSYVRSDRTRYYVERAVHRASWVRQLAPFPSASAPGDGSRPGAQTKATRVGNPAA